jgi:hypothetical protein
VLTCALDLVELELFLPSGLIHLARLFVLHGGRPARSDARRRGRECRPLDYVMICAVDFEVKLVGLGLYGG